MTGAKSNVLDFIASYSVVPFECVLRFTAEFWRFLFSVISHLSNEVINPAELLK